MDRNAFFQSSINQIMAAKPNSLELEALEHFFAVQQGKGWGASTISNEIDACCSLLSAPPKLLIDVGGNHGLYTQEFLLRFPEGQAYIFEPSSTNLSILDSLFSGDDRVQVIGSALADSPGSMTLYSDKPGSAMASLTQRKLDHFGIQMNKMETVDVCRFDKYWTTCRAAHTIIDLVKIDVEGHELSVLKGFGSLIHDVKVFQFEFGGTCIDTRVFFQDYFYFFSSMNFSLYRITPSGLVPVKRYSENSETFTCTNYVAANNIFRQ